MNPNRPQPQRDTLFFSPHAPLRRAINLAILAIMYSPALLANPDGAQIINGQVTIDAALPGVAQITNSPGAVIQWQNFNIAQHEITRFIQQNSQSAVLNRIVGENPSTILGQLASNGKVFLINPNGIVFGANSVIDTQGLVASSLNLSNQDFLNGNYHFIAGAASGNITNEGIIRAGKDGNIMLIAPSITNNGIIKTEGGRITLAAGQELVLTNLDDPDIRFEIQAPENMALNLGKLLAEGGVINVFAHSITHRGAINADSVTQDAQGNIKLVAQQTINLSQGSKLSANNRFGDAGAIRIESEAGATLAQGILEAKATETGKGGIITVLGERVGLLGEADIDASGVNGGGQVLIGGDKQGKNPDIHNAKATYIGVDTHISADAQTSGNGGKVIAWSDNATRAYGDISAKGGRQSGDGGFIETSGHGLDTSGINVNALATHGKGGEWLLDPNDITIQRAGPDTVGGYPDWTTTGDSAILTTKSIRSALNQGTSVTISTGMAGANTQKGDITVASPILKSRGGEATLSLTASNDININAPVISTVGKLNLDLTPDSDGKSGGSTTVSDTLALNSGTLTFKGDSALTSGAVITGDNAVAFIKGTGNIGKDASYKATDTVIDNATVAFSTGNTLHLPTLTIDNKGVLAGTDAIEVSKAFDLRSGYLLGDGKLTTTAASTTTLTEGITLLNRAWDNYGTVGFLPGTPSVGLPSRALSGVSAKHWNNFGTVNYWLGTSGATSELGKVIFLTNRPVGKFNIIGDGPSSVRAIGIGAFNNQGELTMSEGGTLIISSPGTDTGRYNVTGTGLLQFKNSGRIFDGATIKSDSNVSFIDGTNTFKNGAVYAAPEASLDGASLNVDTPLSFNNLTMAGAGRLDNTGGLTAATFNWSGGELTGPGDFNFTDRFNYSVGTMNATGVVFINDTSGTLLLPAMPSITRLEARSSGDLALDGDINAGGGGTAILLATAGRFDNGAGAKLSTPTNGRWLVYSDEPRDTLGGLTADLKHYGCNAGACNDGSTVPAIGNGLLYSVEPVLNVTPNTLSSGYGGAKDSPYGLPDTYTVTGFIDGDGTATADIKGTASFSHDATKSSAGHYNAGRYNVTYTDDGQLTNKLGYKFKDAENANGEWTIAPRELTIATHTLNKVYGDADPKLSTKLLSGVFKGDTVSGELNRASGENVGRYGIAQVTLDNSNYTVGIISPVNLEITPRQLNIMANASSKHRGEPDPAFTYRAQGNLPEDSLDNILNDGALSRIPGEKVGRYTITKGDLEAAPNYTLNYKPAIFTIKRDSVQPEIKQNLNDRQQNLVLVVTKLDTATQASDDSQETESETAGPKPLKHGQATAESKTTKPKPLKQCK